MQLPLRLRTVLGTDSSAIDSGMLAGLIGWREDTDLDFKKDLDRGRTGMRGLVADIAALANARGGVIVVGMREKDTRAVEMVPLEPSGRREDRTEIYQAVAEHTSPTVSLDVHHVEAEDNRYFLVLAVPKSQLAPHALRRPGEHALLFPVREGTRARHMSEPELADRYRDRFRLASELIERLHEVREEGEEFVRRSDDPGAWLSLAVVPETRGRFDISAKAPAGTADWMKGLVREVSPGGRPFDASLQGGVGYRRVIVGDWEEQVPSGAPSFTHCQLHVDGSGFFAQRFGFEEEADKLNEYRAPHGRPIVENERRIVSIATAELLFDSVVTGLSCLARHALDRCGADGDAVVSVRLVEVGRVEATVLASARVISGALFGMRQAPGTHELQGGDVRQTVPLRALHSPSREMMIAVNFLMVDLLSLFGHAGVHQVTREGSVVPRTFWLDLGQDQLSRWANRWGIPTE